MPGVYIVEKLRIMLPGRPEMERVLLFWEAAGGNPSPQFPRKIGLLEAPSIITSGGHSAARIKMLHSVRFELPPASKEPFDKVWLYV
jgi:hypothetical protein